MSSTNPYSAMFTALPNGVLPGSPGSYRLSVLVSPRIDAAAATLAGSPFESWPAVVGRIAWRVYVQAATVGGVAPPSIDPLTLDAYLDPNPAFGVGRFDAQLWATLFGRLGAAKISDGVAQRGRYYQNAGISSYGTTNVSATIKDVYRTAARSTDATGAPARPTMTFVPPGIASPASVADPIARHTHFVARALDAAPAVASALRKRTGATTLSGDAAGNTSAPPDYRDFARASVFHDRKRVRSADGKSPGSPPPAAPSAEFHAAVGQLGDHPSLLRRLGLLVDLYFTPGPALQSLLQMRNVSLYVDPGTIAGGGWSLDVAHPWSYCVVTADDLRMMYATLEDVGNNRAHCPKGFASNGQLDLGPTSTTYSIDDLDVDHAVTHFMQFAEKTVADLSAEAATSSAAPSVEVRLPALRSGGFALHHVDRERELADFMAYYNYNSTITADMNGSATKLHAEDVVRGYRVDVSVSADGKAAGPWTSLCRRRVSYASPGAALQGLTVGNPILDEGIVKASAVTNSDDPALANDPDTATVHTLHESLFHWDGWSLVVQRPGLSIAASPAPTTSVGAAAGQAPRSEAVIATTNAPPAQGWTVPLAIDVRPVPGLPRLRFGQFYRFRVRIVDLAGNDLGHGAASSPSAGDTGSAPMRFLRYEPVAPPTLALRRAVTEGESVEHLVIRSDPYGPTPLDAAGWAAQQPAPTTTSTTTPAASAPNSGYRATCERHLLPPKTSLHMAEYHGAFDALFDAGVCSGALAPAQRDALLRENANRSYRIAIKEAGTLFDDVVLDTSTGSTATQPGRWIVTPPGTTPLPGTPLRQGTDSIPRGDSLATGQYVVFDADTITIPYLPDVQAPAVTIQGLPGGARARTFAPRRGCAWPELAVPRLVLQSSNGGAAEMAGFDDAAPAPDAPVTIGLPAGATLDLTYASTVLHPDAMAFFSEGRDADARAGRLPLLSPTRRLRLVHAVQRPKPPTLSLANVTVAPRAAGDTAITITGAVPVDGVTTGHLDFVAAWQEHVDGVVPAGASPLDAPVPHRAILTSFTGIGADRRMLDMGTVRQLFGDTKRRDVTYTTVATTRFREYFPTSITADAAQITNSSEPVTLIVPSTARPPAPRVLYAVPCFKWALSPDGKTRTRVGGGVRVYVDRGWFASGEDERLAVVLPTHDTTKRSPDPANPYAPSITLPHLVSVWGLDPIWNPTAGALGPLDADHFAIDPASRADRVFRGVQLAEADAQVDVVTFAPNFNVDRQLWYFDIELTTDRAYFPFLRLALARFQPQSIADLRLSTVVRTHFVQLAADRTVSVAPAGSGQTTVTLTGVMPPNMDLSAARDAAQATSGRVVTAEYQEAGSDGVDALDWYTLGEPVLLAPQRDGTGQPMFQGALRAPPDASPGLLHRVLVKEYELYASDDQPGLGARREVLHAGAGEAPSAVQYRLVYADGVPI